MDAYLVRVPFDCVADLPDSLEAVRRAVKHAQGNETYLLNLEESWSGLHFVITDDYPMPKYEVLQRGLSWEDDSLENVLMGGSPTPYGTAYGVARYYSPDEVIRLVDTLSQLTIEEFKSRCDYDWLMQSHVLPDTWNYDDVETCDLLTGYFRKLVDFYQLTAFKGEGLLIYII